MMGHAAQWRVCGAEMLTRAQLDFAPLLARAGLPLGLGGMMPAMPAGEWL